MQRRTRPAAFPRVCSPHAVDVPPPAPRPAPPTRDRRRLSDAPAALAARGANARQHRTRRGRRPAGATGTARGARLADNVPRRRERRSAVVAAFRVPQRPAPGPNYPVKTRRRGVDSADPPAGRRTRMQRAPYRSGPRYRLAHQPPPRCWLRSNPRVPLVGPARSEIRVPPLLRQKQFPWNWLRAVALVLACPLGPQRPKISL